MPIFDYKCEGCGHAFEELVRGDEVILCPKCDTEKVTRQISGFAVGGGSQTSAAPFCDSKSCDRAGGT